jgi:hypothetical protein
VAVAERWTAPERSPWPARLLAAAVALLVTAPALAPGFVLLRDMVFVPRQDLDLDTLGLSGATPRAVPVDAAVALLTAVVPGDVLQKAVLLLTVFAAVLGAARLVPPGPDGRRGSAAVVAGLIYGWSPYLAERLLMGHWTLLCAWAALPWIARATLRVRSGEPRAVPRLVLACASAALSATGALLALGVTLAVGGRRKAVAAAVPAVLSLPWVVAGALSPASGLSDGGGVADFAARAENWGGVLLSVLGTGGLWNAAAVPGSRTSVLVPVLTVLLLTLAGAGWWQRGLLRGPGGRLVLLGLVGVVLACAGAVPGVRELLALAVRTVPGAGLLRDGQKWAAWFALPLAVGAGLGARRLAGAARARWGAAGAGSVLVAAVLLPLVALPDLGWGVGGRLRPVPYPADWSRVRSVLATDTRPGDVLVLPFRNYRAFGWNADRPQLDPAPRWLTRSTLVDDRLVVGGRALDAEDPRARKAGAAADDPAELAGLGVGWVLVEAGTPGPQVPAAVRALPAVVTGRTLALYRVPGAVRPPGPGPAREIAVVAAHGIALGAVLTAVLWIFVPPSTVPLRRRPLRKRVPR